tara:strand:+ start:3299 stop:3607 length:309 start_codon:yes stop_codon:yes gene_type:complete
LKHVDALFGTFKDAYTILKGQTSVLDANDTALVMSEAGNLQLFVPENGVLSDRALALVEIYNAMCRDKAGVNAKDGTPNPENIPYQGFTQPFIDRMKARVND